ncbi:SMI1/KNR4 family protein [Acidovorax sp. LjRoot129]|uniref:SMI1/KNR4 family protein n=1 Tax=Acidovorax sp. LjRoot129 TaxID=3342260 RepID=UPI003ED04B14
MTTENPSEQWPPANCAPLAWPILSSQAERFVWYRSVIEVYSLLWEGHVTQANLAPVSESDLSGLEARLGCPLPPALRAYHSEFGALSLAEKLCSVTDGDTPIQPLLHAYSGISDIAENEADIALASELVVFGDYLGNGNMFCFHRQTGEVYFFDHDTRGMLTPFFSSTQVYLDALMIRCIAEVHENDEGGEAVLVERFGNALVRKWLY